MIRVSGARTNWGNKHDEFVQDQARGADAGCGLGVLGGGPCAEYSAAAAAAPAAAAADAAANAAAAAAARQLVEEASRGRGGRTSRERGARAEDQGKGKRGGDDAPREEVRQLPQGLLRDVRRVLGCD